MKISCTKHIHLLQEIQRAICYGEPAQVRACISTTAYAEIAAHLPKPQPPVFDYAQIAAHLPKPESRPS